MTARPIRRNAQTPDRNGKIFYTSTTSLSHISKRNGNIALIIIYMRKSLKTKKTKKIKNKEIELVILPSKEDNKITRECLENEWTKFFYLLYFEE